MTNFLHEEFTAPFKPALLERLRTHCYKRAPEGEYFTLASGEKSKHYVDVRKLALRGEGLMLLSRMIHTALQYGDFGALDAVAGVALGGCPLATGVSYVATWAGKPFHAVYVRKEAKAHGSKKLVEHPFDKPDGHTVVLLEDVVTTGESSLVAARSLREEGFEVRGIVAVVDRRDTSRRKEDIPYLGGYLFSSMVTLADIIGD